MAHNTLEPPPSSGEEWNRTWMQWLWRVYTTITTTRTREHLSVTNANFGKGNTAPQQVILGNYTGWEFDINDDAVFNIELPHHVAVDEEIAIHLTWYINEAYATNSGEVQWQIVWSSCPYDESEAIDNTTDGGTIKSGNIDIPATAKFLAHNTTLTVPAGSIDEEDTFGITLSRVALTGAGSNPTAKPTITSVHVEYFAKWIGT